MLRPGMSALHAPMVIDSSLAMARLSGKLDELKDVMKLTCVIQL